MSSNRQSFGRDNLYFYDPSVALAVVFSVLYALLSAYHLYLSTWYTRKQQIKHRFTIPLPIAAVVATVGWALRIASVTNKASIPLYAISGSYIVISPIFVCATLYILLTRVIRYSLPEGHLQRFAGISPKWLGRLFITSDVTSFLTQGGGSGVASGGNWRGNSKDIGIKILLVGLALQLATFSLFMFTLWRYMCRVRVNPGVAGFDRSIKKVLTGAWIASVFVQTRSIFRVVEFALGINGYPFQNEWCLYVFEAVPMWIAIAVLCWSHPIRWMQQHKWNESMDGTAGQKTEQSIVDKNSGVTANEP
ncbi:hypothetical protein B0A52_09425 [Exophiala mesophila]|uniref:Uncharacterized protein n=1 Tax=Exophiala mesophila TaxID=212818 RepID=A0A438MUG4_EXOME|nr:hypothetical protein B0A52_09425 [Exophiala mesophila]